MGLLSGIKKAIGGVFKGVKKVFKKVTRFIGKIVGSKWGKLLLMGAAIFTAGTALIAGAQTFAQTSGGFLTRFVAGAKEFVAALAHPIKGFKSILPGGGSLTGPGGVLSQGAAAAGAQAGNSAALSAPSPEALIESGAGLPAPESIGGVSTGTAAGSGGTIPTLPEVTVGGGAAKALPEASMAGLPGPGSAVSVPTGAPALGGLPGTSLPGAAGGGGMMSRAAGGIMDFAKSPGGGTLIGSVLYGMGQASMQKDAYKQANKYNVPFTDEQMASMGGNIRNVPTGGAMARARRISEYLNGRPFGSAPAQVGDPDAVARRALPA